MTRLPAQSTSTSSTKAKAIWQQAQNSNFLRAQNTDANRPLVPTTSIFTLTDEVIPPEPYSSTLPGASNILIQNVCLLHVVDHFLGKLSQRQQADQGLMFSQHLLTAGILALPSLPSPTEVSRLLPHLTTNIARVT